MLTYCYTLISNPCDQSVSALLEYARSHPGCLCALAPADTVAVHRAIARSAR